MSFKKVAFADTVHPILWERLQAAGYECFNCSQWPFDKMVNEAHKFVGLVIRSRFPVNEAFLNHAPHLKWIARSGSGLENIDLDHCSKKRVTVYNSPEGNRQAVAEHALSMLLAMFNKLVMAHNDVRNGLWKREANRGKELYGCSVGIIGYGHMGSAFAQLLKAFSCRILVHDAFKNVQEEGIETVNLDVLKQEAEIISLHLPYHRDNHHYVDETFIQSVRHPFYLINTARGKQVKTSALLSALQNGHVLGACLDVLEYESSAFEQLESHKDFRALLERNDVVFSPHVAGWTEESYIKLSSVLADKILAGFPNP